MAIPALTAHKSQSKKTFYIQIYKYRLSAVYEYNDYNNLSFNVVIFIREITKRSI